jgi:hypothetical protein
MITDIGKEAATNLGYGHCPVSTTTQRLSSVSASCQKGVLIRAPGVSDPVPNTACVWVGDARVLATSDDERGGMPIPPGESLFVPIDDPYRLWVVSTANGQDVAWMAM